MLYDAISHYILFRQFVKIKINMKNAVRDLVSVGAAKSFIFETKLT